MKARTRRHVFVIAMMLAVLLALGYGFMPKPVTVNSARAARGPLRVTIEEEARTRVRERFVISAPAPGFLRRIEFDVGDTVIKGMQVAVLEPLRSAALDPRSRAEAEAAVEAARASLDTARERVRAAAADAEYARGRLERTRELFEGGYVSRDDYDQVEAAAKKADALRDSSEAAANSARAELERAESVLMYPGAARKKGAGGSIILRSPAAGSILKLHRRSESAINTGEPIMDIGDPRRLEVKAEVLSSEAVKIRKGNRVLFERWGGPSVLEGKVRVVEPAGFTKVSSLGVEEQRVLVIVEFTSPYEVWHGLGDGYRLDASFIIWEGSDVLQIPQSALFRKGDGWAVFTIENNKAKLREVEIGRRSGVAAQILSGISEGTAVITNPEDEVKDGAKVRVRD